MTVKLNWDKLSRLLVLYPTPLKQADLDLAVSKLDPVVVYKAVINNRLVSVDMPQGRISFLPSEITVSVD